MNGPYGIWAYVGLHKERQGWLRDPVSNGRRFYDIFAEAQAAADGFARQGITCYVKSFGETLAVAVPKIIGRQLR